MFLLSKTHLFREDLSTQLTNDKAGALVSFEGWVRDHNQGKAVQALEYQVYEELAQKEGQKIVAEALEKFNIHGMSCVHRHGYLNLGEMAVWIGATASHRDDAFKACRYVIDEIKKRLPIWKKEHYVNEKPEWVFCRDHHHHVHFEESDYYHKQKALVSTDILKKSRVLVVGAGGLGCPALISLTQAGVGKITIVDFDSIQFSNLHRQSLYSPNLVGEKKAVVAKNKLIELNPFIQISSVVDKLRAEHLKGHDLVLDCTDNMATKYFLHDLCFQMKIPLVSGSIYRFEGQIRTFSPGKEFGCLRCHVKETPNDALLGNCNDAGVLGASVNILGSLMAIEALTYLTQGINSTLTHSHYYNLKDLSQMKIKNSLRKDCITCKGEHEVLQEDLEILSHEISDEMFVLDIREMQDHEIFSQVNKDKKVVLCCHKGIRSKELTQNLRAMGHEQVFSLKGGACSL